jgi:hypothetical protein
MKKTIPAFLFLVMACGSSDHGGQLTLTWSLQNTNGVVVGCTPNEIVRVTVGGVVQDFPCTDQAATTQNLPSGDFTATFDLIDQAGKTESSTNFPVTMSDDLTTDVGHIVFTVSQ